MRKFLLLGSIILSISLFGQKYRPIDSNMVWNENATMKKTAGGYQCCYQSENSSFQFDGFVLNNGNVWFKLFKSATYGWVNCSFPCNPNVLSSNFTNAHIGYILNDSINKKVYFTPTLTANFVPTSNELVYDFLNKNVGDSLWWKAVSPYFSAQPPMFKHIITGVDSILFNGKYHKKYTVNFNGTVPSYPLWVVEGIGTFRGTWNSYFSDFEGGSILKCFSDQQEARSVTTFTSCSSLPTAICATINIVPEIKLPAFSIHPNPASSILYIDNIQYDNAVVMDIFGKIVFEQMTYSNKLNVQNLPTGLYFVRLRSQGVNYTSKFIKE